MPGWVRLSLCPQTEPTVTVYQDECSYPQKQRWSDVGAVSEGQQAFIWNMGIDNCEFLLFPDLPGLVVNWRTCPHSASKNHLCFFGIPWLVALSLCTCFLDIYNTVLHKLGIKRKQEGCKNLCPFLFIPVLCNTVPCT